MTTMTDTVLSPSRALRQPRRIDRRAILGVFLAVAAFVGSLGFWTLSSDTRAVVVATHDLPVGTTLRDTDLTIARVRVDDAMYQAALPADTLSMVVGKTLVEPVHAQQLLVRAQLGSRPALAPHQLAVTIPVTPQRVAGGSLHVGADVQVLLTTNAGKPEARTGIVLPRVQVYGLGYDNALTVVSTGGGPDAPSPSSRQGRLSSLTLVVTQDQAVALAQAKWSGEVDVALLPPAVQQGTSGDGQAR